MKEVVLISYSIYRHLCYINLYTSKSTPPPAKSEEKLSLFMTLSLDIGSAAALILNKLKYETNVILFQYNLSNEKYKIYNEKMYIIFDEYKNVYINLLIDELSDLSIKDYYNLINKEVNNFINNINKNLNLSITLINEYNIYIDNLSITLLFNTIFNNESFNKLIKNIQEYEKTNLYKINNIDKCKANYTL